MCHFFKQRYHNGITELFVCSRIRHGNDKFIRITHNSGTFTRSKASRIFSLPLVYKDFGTIFIIPRRKCTRYGIGIDKPKPKPIAQ